MCNFTCLFLTICLPSVSFLSTNCLFQFSKMIPVKKGRFFRKRAEREVFIIMVKKILALLLVLLCTLGLMAGCGGKSTEQASSEKPAAEKPAEEQSPEEADDWYELDKDTGILTARIPTEKPGYTWDFTINDESVLELLTCEETEGNFVASFRALQDGETEITFAYTKGSSLDHVRVLGVKCKGGKVTEVPIHTIMAMGLLMEDDLEVAEMRAANNLSAIIGEHPAVTCVSETWDGEDNWQYKTVRQFVKNNGRLWYDFEQYDDADEVVSCEAGYINDDVPGALYTWNKDGLKTMTLCMASEYEALVADRWLARLDGDYETVTESENNEEYNTTVLTTHRQNDVLGISSDIIYFIDNATALITGMEQTEYSDGSVVSVTRSNIMYDEPRLMEERAAMEVLFPEDPCYLTVVVNPGQSNSEEQAFQVDKNTLVEFEALEDFRMFYDVDCTETMDWIDVGQNKLTVYVVPDISK